MLNRRKGAADELIELATEIKEQADAAKAAAKAGGAPVAKPAAPEWRKEPVENRLKYALRKGITEFLQQDIDEALAKYPHAVNVIEGPLMDGMNEVGDSLAKEDVPAAGGEDGTHDESGCFHPSAAYRGGEVRAALPRRARW